MIPAGLSEAFNDHSASIGPKLGGKIPCKQNSCSYLDYLPVQNIKVSFQLETTNSSKVFSLLSKLSEAKATGLDKISAWFLCKCSDLITESLCLIFDHLISTGIFSEQWKCSKLIPLFKQGDCKDLNNYCPISIIPVVGKVFGRVIYDQVYAFLIDNNLLSNRQSGFRCLHSLVTGVLEAINSWAYNIDNGIVNAVILLDLRNPVVKIKCV